MGEWVSIGNAENSGYLAVPETGSGPGVLLLHAWWGLTPVFTAICDHLAAEGFVTLAPRLYPGGETAATIPEAESLVAIHDSDPSVAASITLTALDHLRGLPQVTGKRVGVIGFSLGAYWALEASLRRPDDLSGVVTVYGTNPGDYSSARARYLGHFAEHDEFEPLEAVRELEASIRAAGREVTFHLYPGTGHWFAEPDRPDAYDESAAALMWDRTIAFFRARPG